MGVMGRIDRLLGTHEIGPQNRLIGKGCHRTASNPVSNPFHVHIDQDHDLFYYHLQHNPMPKSESNDNPRPYENRDTNGN